MFSYAKPMKCLFFLRYSVSLHAASYSVMSYPSASLVSSHARKRTNETPSRRYALLRHSISVSFLMLIMCSTNDGDTLYRKDVSITEMAEDGLEAFATDRAPMSR